MGGILIVAVLFFSTVLWTQLDNKLVLLTLLSVLVLAGLDFTTITQNHPANRRGTPPRVNCGSNSSWRPLLPSIS